MALCEQLEDPKLKRTSRQKVVETVTPNQRPKAEPKPEPAPVEAPKVEPKPEPAKEIETDGRPDYSDNPDPRLFAYNLFGEMEPIQQKNNRRQQMTKPEEKPQPVKPSGYRKLTDEELELYGSLNWDDNPPINGFYEAMMSIAHAQIAERERLAAEQKASQEAAEAAGISPGETYIEKTEGDFISGGRLRQPKVTAIPIEPKATGRDMSPHPFSEDIQFYHHNGSMVVDDGQLGFLSDVRKNDATFTPLAVKPEQEKRAMLYVTLSETYQQLYNYEAETHEVSAELREHLNEYYDEFVEKYGNLNEKQNVKFIMMEYSKETA